MLLLGACWGNSSCSSKLGDGGAAPVPGQAEPIGHSTMHVGMWGALSALLGGFLVLQAVISCRADQGVGCGWHGEQPGAVLGQQFSLLLSLT